MGSAEQQSVQDAPWAFTDEEVAGAFASPTATGLDDREARERRSRYGTNRLKTARRRSAIRILADQFKSLIVALLGAAATASFAFGRWMEGTAIGVALLINTLVGFFTELKATRSMEALRDLSKTTTRVRRNGETQEICSDDLVPGDVVILEAGDVVPADLRLSEANNLRADESTLTGESIPVAKDLQTVDSRAAVADRSNMVFKGTAVTSGSGKGLVVATGMRTELGNIAQMAEEAEEEGISPLERRLRGLGRILIFATLAVGVVVAVAGILGGRSWFLVLETAIAMAVAAVPEGLPVVATIALASGVRRMARQNALVNKLDSVETLGATSVICTDKTGTLTENRMNVVSIATNAGTVHIDSSGEGLHASSGGRELTTEGATTHGGAGEALSAHPARAHPADSDDPLRAFLQSVLVVGTLCNNASVGEEGETGDPLEIALLRVASEADIRRSELTADHPERREVAFDPQTKMMATFHGAQDEDLFVAVKGAPEQVLEVCSLSDREKQDHTAKSEELASGGLRVLAFACKRAASVDEEPYEELTFLGMAGLLDPPRKEVAEAIAGCRRAGISTVMVTGDHAATAENVARAVGLIDQDDHSEVVEGNRLVVEREQAEDEGTGDDEEKQGPELSERIRGTHVLARVDPAQKLTLVDTYQDQGQVVAMTGDGVNDAPALRKADVGIAMGKRGTQVAREAADIVLLDDRFGTIVEAVGRGRAIFENIRKFIVFLLSGNLSEVLVVSLVGLTSAPLPLLPLQILYINLIGDVFPALALGLTRQGAGLMYRPPRYPREAILTRRHWMLIVVYSVVIAGTVIGAFAIALGPLGLRAKQAVTVSFVTLVLCRLWHVFNMRDPHSHPIRNEVTRTKYVWEAMGVGIALALVAVYAPGFSSILGLKPPTGIMWALIVGMSFVPLAVIQTAMIFLSRRKGDKDARTS